MVEQTYITILIQSLKKKIQVLDRIEELSQEQRALFQEEKIDMDRLEQLYPRKDKLVEQLNLLDSGFETVYDRVKQELVRNKETHVEEIQQLKELISEVTRRSIQIQTEEARTKQLAEQQFAKLHRQAHQMKKNTKVASQYYKNMANLNVVDPQFMDKKK